MVLSKRLSIIFLFIVVSLGPFRAGGEEKAPAVNPFPIPAGLEPSVEFWKKIFTEYTSRELVFYNAKDASKIYKVMRIGKRRRIRSLMRRERMKIVRQHDLKSRNKVWAQRGAKENFVLGMERSERYMEQIQGIFRERGLPVELAYLPLIESSFQVNARSRAGAVGMWQIMRRTGLRYLRITSTVDERKDPLESTRAAASLLAENYDIFGNWPLAITAYNHGQNGIRRGVSKVGSSNLMELIRKYKSRRFGVSSKNFYAEFVAAVEVAKRDEEYLPDLEYHTPVRIAELKLDQPLSVSYLLRFAGVSRQQFLAWNPALSRRIKIIPKWYRVKVPAEQLEVFAQAYKKAVTGPWVRHHVARGETLSHIAKAYRISIGEIQSLNGLSNINFITIGQQLKIPRR